MDPATPGYIVFYDGHCQFCADGKRRIERMRKTAGVLFVDVQDWSQLRRFPQVDPAAALGQMHVLSPDGSVAGGYDAILALLPAFPTWRRFHWLLSRPTARRLGGRAYKWVARNRYRIAGKTACAGGTCRIA